MQEVGHAALAIIPSFKGFQGDLERGSSKAMLAAGTSGGTQFGDAAGKSAGSRFTSHVKSAAKIAAVGLAAAGAVAFKFAGDSLEEARDAQKVGALTDAVIKSTGKSAKVTAGDVGKLSERLSNMAGVDDELIQSGANVLLTFTKIRNEAGKGNKVFDQATRAALNMSAALKSDLSSASIQVGKALNDPVKGVTALAKAGVQFTEQQKAQIKALVEGGDANAAMALGLIDSTTQYNALLKEQEGDAVATARALKSDLTPAQKEMFDNYAKGGQTLEAQKRIVKELDTQFKGAAKSQATEADKLNVAFGNLKEEVGTELIPVMDDLAVFLRKKGIPAARDFAGWIKDDAAPAIKDFADDAVKVAKKVKPLVDLFADLPTGGKIATIGTAIAGGLTIKHQVSKIFDRGGIANPMFVVVTNPGIPGAPGVPGGSPKTPLGKTPLGKSPIPGFLGIPLPALAALGADTIPVPKAPKGSPKDVRVDKDGNVLGTASGDSAAMVAKFKGVLDGTNTGGGKTSPDLERLAKGFEKAGDKAWGAAKLVDGFTGSTRDGRRETDRLRESIDKLAKARVRPEVDTSSIEAALALFRQLPSMAGVVGPVDPSLLPTTPRAGVTFTGPINVKSNNPREFARGVERETRNRSRGGRG